MNLKRRGTRARWRCAALSVSLAAVAAMGAISLAHAQAGSLGCSRQVKLDRSQPRSEHSLTYKLSCNQDIGSYTIVSTRTVDSFGPEVPVTGPGGQPLNDESFKCEGAIPGDGFRCSGNAKAVNVVTGEFSTESAPCPATRKEAKAGGKLRLWLAAVDKDGKSSEPLRIRGPKCPKRSSKSKRKSRG